MAEVVKAHGLKQMGARGQYVRYPWDKWTDGKARRLRKGKDFVNSVESVLNSARYQARRRGLTVNYRVDGDDSVTLSFSKTA